MKKEIWKGIEGYEGLYEVSNYGRVKSLERTRLFESGKKGLHTRKYRERILKQYVGTTGYWIVVLSKDGIEKTYKVHRLVAKAFISNPFNLPHINHKDENPLNPRADNLEWCDQKWNCNYKNHSKKLSQAQIDSKGRKVYLYDLNGELINVFMSTKDCERAGFNRRAVYSCCKHEVQSHKGYVFRFEGDNFFYEPKKLNRHTIYKFDKNKVFMESFSSARELVRKESVGGWAFNIDVEPILYKDCYYTTTLDIISVDSFRTCTPKQRKITCNQCECYLKYKKE